MTIEVHGNRRIIESNGMPDHEPGVFPNGGNPHAIEPQRQRFAVTTTPERTAEATAPFEPRRPEPGPRRGRPPSSAWP